MSVDQSSLSTLRTFLTQLNYAAKELTHQQKSQDGSKRQNIGEAICAVLDSPMYSNRAQALQLQGQLNHVDQRIKGLWNLFYQEASSRSERSFPTIQRHFSKLLNLFNIDQGLFSDTDLSLSATESASLHKLYETFSSRLRIPNDRPFQEQVKRDFMQIMSRPAGIQLIGKLLEFSWDSLDLIPGSVFTYSPKTIAYKEHQIEYGIAPIIALARVSSAGLDSQVTPSFICLAHELFHMYWRLNEGDGFQFPTTAVPTDYPNWEEYYVIQDENLLRQQFGLPPRETHFLGSNLSDTPGEQLLHSIASGADAQMKRVLPLCSEAEINKAIQATIDTFNFDAFQKIQGLKQELKKQAEANRGARRNLPPITTHWQQIDIPSSMDSSPSISPQSSSPSPNPAVPYWPNFSINSPTFPSNH